MQAHHISMQGMQGIATDLQGVHWQDAHRQYGQDRLLRAEDVAKSLGIDRSTVYRMAEAGQLQAVKIGRQWRFRVEEIEQLLQAGKHAGYVATTIRLAMASALQVASPMIDMAAQILGIMMVVTDMNGTPLTEMFNPCPWFVEHSANSDLMAQCIADWKYLADAPDFDARLRSGPLNLDRARSFVRVGAELTGMVLAGGIATDDDDERALFRLSKEGRERVLTFLPIIAAKVSRLVASALRDQSGEGDRDARGDQGGGGDQGGDQLRAEGAHQGGYATGVRDSENNANTDDPAGTTDTEGSREQRRIQ